MPRREDVDLELVLRDPRCAREWIKAFNWEFIETPKYIVFGLDERIYFDKMTDEEAVFAAKLILRDVEIPRVIRELNLLNPDLRIH